MKLARYWSRGNGEAIDPDGERIRITARGWSDESIELARVRAREVAQRAAQRLAAYPGDKKRYQYGDRPLPEPILQEFKNGGATPYAVVTRNAYGALVLNSDHLMFIDIDREDPAPSTASGTGLESAITGLFSSLFGHSAPAAAPAPAQAPPGVVNDIQQIAQRRGLSVRVYKTAAGYRGLVTNKPFDAGTSATEDVLREFGADRMYMHLCRVQESFRARLTPKPWRCHFHKPPVEFPFETPQSRSRVSPLGKPVQFEIRELRHVPVHHHGGIGRHHCRVPGPTGLSRPRNQGDQRTAASVKSDRKAGPVRD